MIHVSQALDDSFDELDRALNDLAPEQAQRLRKLRRNQASQIGFDRETAMYTRVIGHRKTHAVPLNPNTLKEDLHREPS